MQEGSPIERLRVKLSSAGLLWPQLRELSRGEERCGSAGGESSHVNCPSCPEYRNVVIVGRSRGGKSTLLKVLRDPLCIADAETLHAQTRSSQRHSFEVMSSDDSASTRTSRDVDCDNGKAAVLTSTKRKAEKRLIINVLDTPGLFERNGDGSVSRLTHEICDDVLCGLRQLTAGTDGVLHVMLIVMTVVSGVSDDDMLATWQMSQLFQNGGHVAALVVSYSEGLDVEERQAIVRQLKSHPIMSRVMQSLRGGVFFTGCIEFQEEELSVAHTERIATRVARDRTLLLRHILASDKGIAAERRRLKARPKVKVVLAAALFVSGIVITALSSLSLLL